MAGAVQGAGGRKLCLCSLWKCSFEPSRPCSSGFEAKTDGGKQQASGAGGGGGGVMAGEKRGKKGAKQGRQEERQAGDKKVGLAERATRADVGGASRDVKQKGSKQAPVRKGLAAKIFGNAES